MLTSYYYNKQIKNYILQFANIFSGLIVKTGKDANGEIKDLNVPVVYASKDRVVAGLSSGGTQNKLHTLPMMSCYMTGIELAPERRKGVNAVDRRTYIPQGGIFLEDVEVAYRLMPIPYNLTFDLYIYVSNSDQSFQILEQLLMIFDPTLQLQTSEAALDWTKINSVELTGINNEENIPSGTEKRMIIWTLSFMVTAWISAPLEVKKNIVQKIILEYGGLETFTLFEFDENGEPKVFGDGDVWDVDIIESPHIVISEPPPEEKF
jgi:hypothetical protein